ncbi:MAG: selenide, water dikinase SelD, partial [Anaerolineae bacterium]
GGVLAGGHTIDDKEPKYGLSVMGIVHPDRVWTKATACPGDALMLTKPLGVGIITTVLKSNKAAPQHVTSAVESMKELNREAARIMQDVDVHAVTDVTGFALLGHGHEMAETSGVRLRFHLDRIPFLAGAQEYAGMRLFPGGTCNNEEAYQHAVTFAPEIDEEMRQLLYTPETSGGLLAAVPPEGMSDLIRRFDESGHPCWVIGEVVEGEGVHVVS